MDAAEELDIQQRDTEFVFEIRDETLLALTRSEGFVPLGDTKEKFKRVIC